MGGTSGIRFETVRIHFNESLNICAPKKDLNLKGLTKNSNIFNLPMFKAKHISIPDPVVLCRVEGGYLIVTAWGDEASDIIISNENLIKKFQFILKIQNFFVILYKIIRK